MYSKIKDFADIYQEVPFEKNLELKCMQLKVLKMVTYELTRLVSSTYVGMR